MCSWNAKKQSSIALSTCESEYYAMTMAAQETIWARRVMDEAGLKVNGPTTLRTDNQGAILWATGDRSPSSRAKHIEVRVHFIREFVSSSPLKLEYVPSEENYADLLTKPLGPTVLKRILSLSGLGGAVEEDF